MAGTFTTTLIKKVPICADTIMVIYTWLAAGGNTGAGVSSSAYLSHIDSISYSNSVSAGAVKLEENVNSGASDGDFTLTCTANDGGTVTIIGRPAR